MRYRTRLRIPDELARDLAKLIPDLKRRLRAGLDRVIADSRAGKALLGELAGLRSLRIGRMRVIYRTAPGKVIEIVAIGPRQTIYEETRRLVRREQPGS